MSERVNTVPDSAFVLFVPDAGAAEPELPRALSFLEDSWRKLRKNKAAVVTLILLIFSRESPPSFWRW